MQAVPRKAQGCIRAIFRRLVRAADCSRFVKKHYFLTVSKKPGRFPGRALGHMGLTAQNWISLPFLRHCLNSATAVNSASDEELMAVSSES